MTEVSIDNRPARAPVSRSNLLDAFAATIIPILAVVGLAWMIFEVRYGVTAIAMDTLLLFPALALAAGAVRRRAALWVFGALLAVVLVLGHAVKVAFLGNPISSADLAAGIALLRVLSGERLVFAVLALTAFLGLLGWAAWPRRQGWIHLAAVAGYVIALLVAAPPVSRLLSHDATSEMTGTDPVQRLQRIGGAAYLLQDFARHRQGSAHGPDQASVIKALGATVVQPQPVSTAPGHARNLHLILLEAFWDPTALTAYRFSRDPLDPRFRAMWERGGHSTILSPVFGGATANAEFEVLCGLPAVADTIVFSGALSNPVPCLPRVLRQAGYLTITNHPNSGNYWNRGQAYPLLGFERYNAIGAFQLDDMDGMFLDDASTFRQTLKRVEALPSNRPYFNYLVSLSTHYPYGRNAARHPALVIVSPEAPVLEAYANALAYSSAAFMDYVEALRTHDPDALIVAFGDHAPVLGLDPDPYALSGMSPKGGDPKALAALSQTPLLVIDGRRGPVEIGAVALYAVPSRVLSLLDKHGAQIPYTAAIGDASARVFLGRVLARTSSGWEVCIDQSPQCQKAAAMLDRTKLLRDDLISGQQYTLQQLHAQRYSGHVDMTKNDLYGECMLDVVEWGPKTAPQGKPFNKQPSGRSALWFKLREGRGVPQLLIGRDVAPVTLDANRGSASYLNPGFLQHAGRYPVRYRCEDGKLHEVGSFVVTAH